MYLGKVIGRVVASVKDPALEGRTLLLIRRLPSGPADDFAQIHSSVL